MTDDPLNVLSLFSGIGGLDLGLQRAGMTIAGHVESDPYCRQILERHWPEVPQHDDVRTALEWWASQPRPRVDVVAGGFPCQPVSWAGKGLGREDERWLWPAFADVVRVLRPRYVLVENVTALANRGLADVLGSLAGLGFDAVWNRVAAASVGAPHRRWRLFVIASHPGRPGPQGRRPERGLGEGVPAGEAARSDWWTTEPDVARVVHGVPGRVDRIRALGNCVVPQVGEFVGRILLAAEAG